MAAACAYNTAMIAALLAHALQARMPAPVTVALLIVVAASALSLYVSILVARRLRSIGEANDRPEASDAPAQESPPASSPDG